MNAYREPKEINLTDVAGVRLIPTPPYLKYPTTKEHILKMPKADFVPFMEKLLEITKQYREHYFTILDEQGNKYKCDMTGTIFRAEEVFINGQFTAENL